MGQGDSKVIDRGKHNILGVLIDAIDYEAAVSRIIAAAQKQQSFITTALAVHGVMTGYMDAEHRHRLNCFDLAVPDGQPVRWTLNWLHKAALPDRVYGPTLMLKVCEEAEKQGLSIGIYGSTSPVLESLTRNLQQRFPQLKIALIKPSYFRQLNADEDAATVQEIIDKGVSILFIGMGCPRQEVWAYEHRDVLPAPIISVGAAFDFHAGTLAQSPAVLQNAGLEWLFRLFHEPRRLWKRYVILNPLYISLIVQQAFRLRHFDPKDSSAPRQYYRYG
jgi:exopolysaccharide biosynthesis WecB/TagA/CpsF family protein